MKKITANKRIANIIARAIDNGFEPEMSDSYEDNFFNAEQHLIDKFGVEEEENCEVNTSGHNQHFHYADGMGYEMSMSGEIVSFREHWHDAANTRVIHTTIVNSEAKVIGLYYEVGVTDYNKS